MGLHTTKPGSALHLPGAHPARRWGAFEWVHVKGKHCGDQAIDQLNWGFEDSEALEWLATSIGRVKHEL